MLAAAAAWDGLAEELGSAAVSFGQVTSGLTAGVWQGAAAAAMAAAAAPYAGWLGSVAAQAVAVAGQARAAVAAFEAALAATVDPAAVAVNRMAMRALAMSNLLGQNAAAIAAVEAEYELMWAADVAAMAGLPFPARRMLPWRCQGPTHRRRSLTQVHVDAAHFRNLATNSLNRVSSGDKAGADDLFHGPRHSAQTSSPPASPEATVPDHHPVKAALQEIQADMGINAPQMSARLYAIGILQISLSKCPRSPRRGETMRCERIVSGRGRGG